MSYLKNTKRLFLLATFGPVLLFLRLINPIVRIRFIQIQKYAIGTHSGCVDTHLINKIHQNEKRTIDIYYACMPSSHISNQQLERMWSRTLRTYVTNIWLSKLISIMEKMCYKISFFHPLRYNIWPDAVLGTTDRDKTGIIKSTPSFLKFTKKESMLGEKFLNDINVANKKFIILHSRDNKFHPGLQTYRNSHIENFLEAAKHLTSHGYCVIRTGALVNNGFYESENIIDYATKYRTDFLDIYLSSKCDFYFGDDCGLYNVSTCFRKPLVILNIAPFIHAPFFYDNAIYIPKKYWLIHDKRYMTFSEILKSEAKFLHKNEDFQSLGIELHENTSTEILELADEVMKRRNNAYIETDGDKEMQTAYTQLVSNESLIIKRDGAIRGRIATSFLRRNKFMLSDI